MHRVLVHTPDLLFYSQVKGVADAARWSCHHLGEGFPEDGVDGDTVVIDATRDLDSAWRRLEAAREAGPGLVMVCHQHKHMEVGEEALRRGATEAVRRGAFLQRLGIRLGIGSLTDKAPFVGKPPD